MTLTVKHASLTGAAANPDVLVDGPKWDAEHTITGSISASEVTGGSELSRTNDTNVTITLGGTPETALLQATSITVGWTGTLAASRGGFGADVSSSSGVPLFATGTATFTGTTGTGNFVRATSPTLVTPALGTPSSGTLTNCTAFNLTTTGSSGAATYSAGTLNIPQYSGTGYPPGHIYGLTLSNNVSTPNTVLDVASGSARDIGDTANMTLASGISKSLASNWAVGTGNGGLDTGSKANSTCYHVWLIRRSDTGVVDVLFSTSATSPTMPTNYDAKRRIGAIFTDSSGNIKAFYQTPGTGEFRWRTTAAPRDINSVSYTGLTPTLASVSVPTGIKVKGIFLFNPGSGTGACSLTDPDAGVPPDNTYSQASAGNFNEVYSWTSSSGQVYVTTGVTGTVSLWTKGWFDFRDAAF